MKDTILILTNSEDGKHTDVVIEKLRQADQKYFRFDSDRFINGELIVKFGVDNLKCGFTMHSNGQILHSADIKGIWYRRPNHFNAQIKDPIQKRYAEEEIQNLLNGLWSVIPNVFWLSNPKNLERARRKLLQLKIAREIGFLIPETIVTNDPTCVREFFNTHNGRIVFKALYHEFLNYGDHSFNIPTTLITEKHMEKIGLVKKMPSLFQRLIEKEYELRVTLVENKVFAVKIDSQANPFTIVDWRHPEYIDKLSYCETEISKDISNNCRYMLKRLGLAFGAFDFIAAKDGKIYFLEVNPNGQWYWLEDLAGVLISDAIANSLSLERGKGGSHGC